MELPQGKLHFYILRSNGQQDSHNKVHSTP